MCHITLDTQIDSEPTIDESKSSITTIVYSDSGDVIAQLDNINDNSLSFTVPKNTQLSIEVLYDIYAGKDIVTYPHPDPGGAGNIYYEYNCKLINSTTGSSLFSYTKETGISNEEILQFSYSNKVSVNITDDTTYTTYLNIYYDDVSDPDPEPNNPEDI